MLLLKFSRFLNGFGARAAWLVRESVLLNSLIIVQESLNIFRPIQGNTNAYSLIVVARRGKF